MSLRHGILGLLSREPMTGYNLKKLFDRTLSNVWAASLSQIYRELNMLEKDGLLVSTVQEQDDRPDKRVYAITPSGKQAFQAWLMQNPEAFLSPKRDEFMLRMFFGAQMGAEHVKEQLRQFQRDRELAGEALEKEAQKLADMPASFAGFPDTGEGEKYIRFILRRAIMTNRLLVAWAEECANELEESKG